MDSFSKIIQLTSLKVEKLNEAIDALEVERYQKTAAELAAYTEDRKGASVFVWLSRPKAPKVFSPAWHQDQSRANLHAILAKEHIDLNQLAAELNLYVLNVAISLTRLKADKGLVLLAEELRQLSEQLRNVNSIENPS